MATQTRATRRSLWAVGVALVLVAALLAWWLVDRSGDDASAGSSSASSATPRPDVASPSAVRRALAAGATPIDVRTAAEFARGHLAGAQNIDVSSDGFGAQVSTLDPQAGYVVYCATGRRAAKAIEQMESAGFTELLNGGGYDDLAAAGLATEREDAVR